MLEFAHIYQEIESHPPLMQDEAKKKYLGQEVEWLLKFSGGSVDQEEVRVMFRNRSYPAARPFGGVTGKVVLSAYPWLKSLRAEELVHVRGRICQIHQIGIELDILELSLAEPAETTSQK